MNSCPKSAKTEWNVLKNEKKNSQRTLDNDNKLIKCVGAVEQIVILYCMSQWEAAYYEKEKVKIQEWRKKKMIKSFF